jgi:hypothetical protein
MEGFRAEAEKLDQLLTFELLFCGITNLIQRNFRKLSCKAGVKKV